MTQTKIPSLTVSNPWWGHDPSDKQWLGLYAYEDCPDLFYGGAAGPGKTSYLLMAAVQYVHLPHYRALILRKTYADLSLPGAIMDRAIDWWDGVEGARFSHSDKTCYFPSGASVTFGYLASVRDHFRYQGAEVHFIGIDEASQIPSHQLRYLHSRIRKSKVDPIPARYRLASNPGDVSHDWLKDTYVNGADGDRVVYLPGLMTDNPGLDVEEYRKQLAHLDSVTRKQLEEGGLGRAAIRRRAGRDEAQALHLRRVQPAGPVLGLRCDETEGKALTLTGRLACSWGSRTGSTRCRTCSGSVRGPPRWRLVSGVRRR